MVFLHIMARTIKKNNVSLESEEEMEEIDESRSIKGNYYYDFTKDQYGQLVNLLQNSPSQNQNVSSS